MRNKSDISDQDTTYDTRRAEHDAKRDMLDAAKQDAYDAKYARDIRDANISGLTLLNRDEQETTED